jgi:hypothetical protein
LVLRDYQVKLERLERLAPSVLKARRAIASSVRLVLQVLREKLVLLDQQAQQVSQVLLVLPWLHES